MANGSYNPTTQQESPNNNNSNRAYHGCVSKGLQVTGILHIVAGSLCILFGAVAIILKAFASYVAISIWTGLLVFIVTGTLGVVNYWKPQNKNIVTAYLVMSTISAMLSFIMMVVFSIFTANEDYYWYPFACHPISRASCESPTWSRILVDGLLILIFFLELACGITSASLSCYKQCRQCRQCCGLCRDKQSKSHIVYYAANMGGAPMMTVPSNQCTQPIYIAGGRSGTGVEPAQMMYVAPSPQPQTFVQLPVGTQQNTTIPLLSPPPQQQQVLQEPGVVHQTSGFQTGQAGIVQAQDQGQMQQKPTPDSKSSSAEPAEVVQQHGEPQQPATVVQQTSGFTAGQAGSIPVQGPGPMQLQTQAQGLQMQPQVLASSPGQVGFIQAPPGQIQMIPAYPQVVMMATPQQPLPPPQPQSDPKPRPDHKKTEAQQQVQNDKAPSQAAKAQAEDEEPQEVPCGEITSGQFSDEAALV